MANELKVTHTQTGQTLYALIFNSDGQVWSTTGTPAFVTYATANLANYAVSLTELGTASRIYMGNFPTGITAAEDYSVSVFARVGGSPAEGDALVATGRIVWTSTEEGSLAQTEVIVADISATLSAPLDANIVSIEADVITSSVFADGAITSGALADNAITAGTLDATVAAEIADSVWDEDLTGHAMANTGGARLDATVSSRASASNLAVVATYLDTEIAAILADTEELQADWADGGRLDLLLDAVKAQTDNLPADPASAAAVAADFVAINAKLDAIDDFLDTEITALLSVTAKVDTAMELDGAAYRFTAAALAEAPTGGGGGGSGPTAVEIRQEIDANSAGLAAIYTTAVAIKAQTGSIESRTQQIQDRLPASLESGRMRCYVGAIAADVSASLAAAPLDLANGVESGITLRQAMRLVLAAAAGRITGADTETIVIRDAGDTKDRITATVDVNGNRLSLILDAT